YGRDACVTDGPDEAVAFEDAAAAVQVLVVVVACVVGHDAIQERGAASGENAVAGRAEREGVGDRRTVESGQVQSVEDADRAVVGIRVILIECRVVEVGAALRIADRDAAAASRRVVDAVAADQRMVDGEAEYAGDVDSAAVAR